MPWEHRRRKSNEGLLLAFPMAPLSSSVPPPLPEEGGKLPELALAWLLPMGAGVWLLWMFFGLPLPGCIFHAVTSWPCLTCGMSRGGRELLSGDFLAAFLRNPLNLLLPLGVAGTWIYCLLVLGGLVRPVRPHRWSSQLSRRVRWGLLVSMGLLWTYLLLRHTLS